MNRNAFSSLVVSSLMLAIVWGPGCSAPKGDSGGRVPIDQMTKGERRTDQMRTADLAEASDGVAQAISADIDRLVEQDFGGYRVTVMVGDIENTSQTMPTQDFEYVRDRIRNKLLSSSHVRDNVKFVDTRRRMERLNEREYGGGQEDLLQEGRGGAPGVERSDPRYTFYLNGTSRGIHRGATHLLTIAFELTRATDGEIVFSQMYEQKYAP
jgi:hypothetical protein